MFVSIRGEQCTFRMGLRGVNSGSISIFLPKVAITACDIILWERANRVIDRRNKNDENSTNKHAIPVLYCGQLASGPLNAHELFFHQSTIRVRRCQVVVAIHAALDGAQMIHGGHQVHVLVVDQLQRLRKPTAAQCVEVADQSGVDGGLHGHEHCVREVRARDDVQPGREVCPTLGSILNNVKTTLMNALYNVLCHVYTPINALCTNNAGTMHKQQVLMHYRMRHFMCTHQLTHYVRPTEGQCTNNVK